MQLSERLARLEAITPSNANKAFCASAKHQSHDDYQALAQAVSTGYWDRLLANPEVARTYATRMPTAEQWANVTRIARELMATEAPDPNDSGFSLQTKF